jgi:hypothetical protein
MGCACNEGQAVKPEPWYEVKYPNGEKKTVSGEHAAKVLVTMGPAGTTYSKM